MRPFHGPRQSGPYSSEAAGDFDVVEIAQVIADADVVEEAAEATEGNAHAVRTAETAELAATFHMRLQIDEDARYAALFELLLERGNVVLEIAEHQLVAAVSAVGRDKVLECFFIHVRGPLHALRMPVV